MAEKAVADAGALMGALNQAGNVGEHEVPLANVHDADGNLLGSTVIDGSGQGSVVVPPSHGGDAVVTLSDAAGNTSPETPVTLPDTFMPDELALAGGAAVLSHTVDT